MLLYSVYEKTGHQPKDTIHWIKTCIEMYTIFKAIFYDEHVYYFNVISVLIQLLQLLYGFRLHSIEEAHY